MARNKKDRIIQMAPHFNGFRPTGLQCKEGTEVSINFEEYEAINLCDYELLTQAEAAKLMQISRPTFTRVYESARRKISQAFVEGGVIHFEGGNSNIQDWYKCNKCEITFTLKKDTHNRCPLCKSEVILKNN